MYLLQIQDKLFWYFIISISSSNNSEESFNSKIKFLAILYIQKCITYKDYSIS